MENIDDECDQNDIAFVKIDDLKEAQEYGVLTFPQLIFFEKRIPHIYEGKLFVFFFFFSQQILPIYRYYPSYIFLQGI